LPELVNVLPHDTSPSFTAYFCYPQELRRSRRVLAFRDFLLVEVDKFNRDHASRPESLITPPGVSERV
jgi:hypothetical protein